ERVVSYLKDKFPTEYGDDDIAAHHSSLSKDLRFSIEENLRDGKLKVVVCIDGNTEILLDDGSYRKIKDLKEGYVQTINKELRLSSNNVISKTSTTQRKTIILKSNLGREIRCTPEHKFLSINSSGDVVWKEARHFKKKDTIGIVRAINSSEIIRDDFDIFLYNNYPDDGFLKINNDFLDLLKTLIKEKHKSIKSYHKSLGLSIGYSTFTHALNGKFLLKVECYRRLLKDLEINNNVAVKNIIGVSSGKSVMPRPSLNKEFIRIIGFMLAEGYISSRSLFISNKNEKVLEFYSDIIERLSGKTVGKKLGSTGTPILIWESVFMARLLKNIGFHRGRKARIIKLPEIILRLPEEYLIEFLSACWDGDGFIEKKENGRVYSAGYCTTSREFANDISNLLLRLGIMSSVRKRYHDEIQEHLGRKIIKKGYFYTVSLLGGEHLRRFAEKANFVRDNLKILKSVLDLNGYCNIDVIPNIGMKLKKLRVMEGISAYNMQKFHGLNPGRYETGGRSITRNQLKRLLKIYKNKDSTLEYLSKSDIFWDRIKELNSSEEETVYNIEIETDHNYIANSFITKNCSTSLELGIDIGFIDLVIMLGSPKASSRATQRLGRSGHKLHDVAKGRFIITDRDDLVECSVIQKEMIDGRIDKIQFPHNALDVLSQHIYGMAIHKVWDIDEILGVIRKSYCYQGLSKDDFFSVISYLSGDYSLEKSYVYGKIWYDEVERKIGKRGKMARVIYLTNIGTIPEESFITVKMSPSGVKIGVIDESFIERMKKGDVFVLGGSKYQYMYTKGMNLYVKSAVHRNPTIPSWFSEMLPLSFDTALEISKLRMMLRERFEKKVKKKEMITFLKDYLYTSEHIAGVIYEYFLQQFSYSVIPDSKNILVERYHDSKLNKNYLLFHSMYGRRVNDALSRALGFLISKAAKKRDVELGISDRGFYIAGEVLPLEKALKELTSDNLKLIVEEAVEKTDILTRRFRHCATRSLMILRMYKGQSKSVKKQQMKSHFLIAAVKKISRDFPILKEAKREVLEDLMDVINAKKVLEEVSSGRIKITIRDTDLPSPFALGLILQGHTDLIRMEDRQDFLRRMHKIYISEIKKKSGMSDYDSYLNEYYNDSEGVKNEE
ncbi:hypothetical protein COU61_04360, partial [Candidatus Pacearchaeota archaeon CG10_big_fil_rev_8_21_14_0_10_35_13]